MIGWHAWLGVYPYQQSMINKNAAASIRGVSNIRRFMTPCMSRIDQVWVIMWIGERRLGERRLW